MFRHAYCNPEQYDCQEYSDAELSHIKPQALPQILKSNTVMMSDQNRGGHTVMFGQPYALILMGIALVTVVWFEIHSAL